MVVVDVLFGGALSKQILFRMLSRSQHQNCKSEVEHAMGETIVASLS